MSTFSRCILFPVLFLLSTPLTWAEAPLTTLFSFKGKDGASPAGGLIEDSVGNFYGTTSAGGTKGLGSIFKITPSGSLKTLVNFTGSNGATPLADLIQGRDGYYYGSTSAGGVENAGTLFKMHPKGGLNTLVFLGKKTTGFCPKASLVEGIDGNFYGSTSDGPIPLYGASLQGTYFKMTPSGELTTLVAFPRGGYPRGALVQHTDGNFYGATHIGGGWGVGYLFKMTPEGVMTALVEFVISNGGYPNGDLILGDDGNYYGLTEDGGTTKGTAFRLSPEGVFTTLTKFRPTGYYSVPTYFPQAGLTQGSDGYFYGTTLFGGVSDLGTVFKISPQGVLTVLASFTGANGSKPVGNVIQGRDGYFYGMTPSGGAYGLGTVFKLPLTQPQTIRFSPIPEQSYGKPLLLGASSTSGLPVMYRVISGPAKLEGNLLTFNSTGTVKLVADQPGDDKIDQAPQILQTFQVSLGSQTLSSFNIIPSQAYSLDSIPFTVPKASSGLYVKVSVKSGPATVSSDQIKLTGTGVVTLIATQNGDRRYLPAEPVTTSFTVSKGVQKITFDQPANHTYGDPFLILAYESSSRLLVTGKVSGPGKLSGDELTINGAGVITVTASQAGNANFEAATPVTRKINVAKAPQSISFPAIGEAKVGSMISLKATATSGLPVTFTAKGDGTIMGNILKITGAGTVRVTAYQGGNGNYLRAIHAVQVIRTK